MRWPPFHHIFFDCDSTLTTVEGIDILAETSGKKWRIEVLTNAAMNGELDLGDVYDKRLQAIRPTRKQIREIHRVYKRNIVEDAADTITILHALGHHVYIISGGLAEPVEEFGVYLGVPRERIRAVGVDYNALSGTWWEQDPPGDEHYMAYHEGALTISDGKAQIVKELLGDQNGRSLLIGDGSSDLLAGRAVDLFVGFGGVVARQRVLEEAPIFILSPSIAPLLALALGPAGLRRLQKRSDNLALHDKTIELIQTGAMTFKNERIKSKFNNAFTAAYPSVHSRPS